jgi:hypothetical protein
VQVASPMGTHTCGLAGGRTCKDRADQKVCCVVHPRAYVVRQQLKPHVIQHDLQCSTAPISIGPEQAGATLCMAPHFVVTQCNGSTAAWELVLACMVQQHSHGGDQVEASASCTLPSSNYGMWAPCNASPVLAARFTPEHVDAAVLVLMRCCLPKPLLPRAQACNDALPRCSSARVAHGCCW